MVVSSIRPTWTEYYLGIAEAVAKRGECTRRQVGAVIVNHKKSCLDGMCPRAWSDATPGTGYAASGCTAIHAEANAIIRAGRARTVGATMYVTSEPCDLCSSLLDAAGIARTIWR